MPSRNALFTLALLLGVVACGDDDDDPCPACAAVVPLIEGLGPRFDLGSSSCPVDGGSFRPTLPQQEGWWVAARLRATDTVWLCTVRYLLWGIDLGPAMCQTHVQHEAVLFVGPSERPPRVFPADAFRRRWTEIPSYRERGRLLSIDRADGNPLFELQPQDVIYLAIQLTANSDGPMCIAGCADGQPELSDPPDTWYSQSASEPFDWIPIAEDVGVAVRLNLILDVRRPDASVAAPCPGV